LLGGLISLLGVADVAYLIRVWPKVGAGVVDRRPIQRFLEASAGQKPRSGDARVSSKGDPPPVRPLRVRTARRCHVNSSVAGSRSRIFLLQRCASVSAVANPETASATPAEEQALQEAEALSRGTGKPFGIRPIHAQTRATVMVLNAIYEGDFVGFSYGFRPGRGPHDALDALTVAITTRKVNWILDADVQNFFGSVSQDWLVQFLEHRIGDKRIIRLIRKWLRAGILEDGVVTVDDRGTGQGSVISPLLANVYLHYCFDLWAERWRRQEAYGDMIIVRYADDLVVGFEHEDDARRFLDAMRERVEAFALTLHSDKTRLIEFGRYAATNRKTRGLGKPETFTFLGFIHICGKSRRGNFLLERKTRRDRLRTKLQDIKAELRRRMHQPIPVQGKWLRQIITGHFAYYAVPANGRALSAFRYYVADHWRRTLRRRSQRDGFTWDRMTKLADDWLPQPRILHTWPQQRFAVTHPR